MSARFRDYLEKLIAIGELEHVREEVDLRHVSARIAASRTALWFTRVRGYDIGVVTGIVGSRARMGAALDCHHRDIGKAFLKRISERKPPVMVNTGPVRDVISRVTTSISRRCRCR
jgi:UbiD family decarboxylase